VLHRPLYKKYFWLISLLLCCYITANGQSFNIAANKKRVTLPFQLVRNLIVIKLKINNAGPYNFILDTGIGFMIITDPLLVDSISIVNKRIVKVAGLGNGDSYEAYITPILKVDIPELVSHNVAAAIFKKDHFDLSRYSGMRIHGLLGYEFFNQLAVRINFADSLITVSRPRDMRRFKKGVRVPLTIEEGKPYAQIKITRNDGLQQVGKLIVDLGAGHPLSLENLTDKEIFSNQVIDANLGIGLSGSISGYMGRVKAVDIGKYSIKNVLSSFPETNMRTSVKRDGNLGVDILKKFNLIFDYSNNELYLKPGIDFKTPFEHDMSGLEFYAAGENFKHIIIDRVEPNSAGEEAGLCINDEITAINFKPVAEMSLGQIDLLFKSRNNHSLLLDVNRNNAHERIILTLKRRI
jgi:hypothetical protein